MIRASIGTLLGGGVKGNMEYYDGFAANYERARTKFLDAAAKSGGDARSAFHPEKMTDQAVAGLAAW